MDPDLRDLLAVFLNGEDLDEGRREALLERLRTDAGFQLTVFEELRMIGMLRVVQSAEPRWLALADAMGMAEGSAREDANADALAERIVAGLTRQRRRRLVGRSVAIALACTVLVAVVGLLALRPGAPPAFATLIQSEGVDWEGRAPAEGSRVAAGPLRFRSGRITLRFTSGVTLTAEGPADLEVHDAGHVSCRRGRLRTRVPAGAEGFTVSGPGYEAVDLGTEFGLNVPGDGRVNLMVFQGEVALSVLGSDGVAVGAANLRTSEAVEANTNSGQIRGVPPNPAAFIMAPPGPAPVLDLPSSYQAEVLASRPWGYWRFERLNDGVVPNEVSGRPSLRGQGPLALSLAPGGNHWVMFRANDPSQVLLMDDTWMPPREYAIELWVWPLPASRNVEGRNALVSLIEQGDEGLEKHLALVELVGRGGQWADERCAVRTLVREPPAQLGGVNVFSRRNVSVFEWHHVVSQVNDHMLELYVDGVRVGMSAVDAVTRPKSTPCQLVLGRLKRFTSLSRPFQGGLDEVAVYGHPLSAEVIRSRAAFRRAP